MPKNNKKIFAYVYTGLNIICLPFNLVNAPNVIHDSINKLEAYRIAIVPKEVKEFGDTLAGNPDKAIEELKSITQDNNDLSNNISKNLSETKHEIENIKAVQTKINTHHLKSQILETLLMLPLLMFAQEKSNKLK